VLLWCLVFVSNINIHFVWLYETHLIKQVLDKFNVLVYCNCPLHIVLCRTSMRWPQRWSADSSLTWVIFRENDDGHLPSELSVSPRFRSTLCNVRVIRGCQIGSVRGATVERTNIPPTNGIQQYLWILTHSALNRCTEHSRFLGLTSKPTPWSLQLISAVHLEYTNVQFLPCRRHSENSPSSLQKPNG